MTTQPTANGYTVGSFAWIERENARTLRHLLDRLVAADERDRDAGTDVALRNEMYCVRDELFALDTDSASR
jgi:hypothetical protein